jgi:4-carboxymuconolactone decarboxylase
MVAVVVVILGFGGAARGQDAGASGAASPLPKDVYPESRFRLPLVPLPPGAPAPSGGALAGRQGPSGIREHSPKLAEAMSPVTNYLRNGTELGNRLTELAILVTAREFDHQFEWTLHEPAGRQAGLEQEIIDIVKYRKDPSGLGEKEKTIIRFGRELFGKRKVSSETFAEALRLFGDRTLVDLTSLMAHYSATAALLNAFDMQLDPKLTPLLPIP